MNLIRSNPESRIYSTTKDALSSLPAFSESSKDGDADASFPNTALDILSKSLRGVGPATASLILSVSTAASPITAQAPFFSDELYWWLCAERYPVLPSLSAEGVSVKGANQTKPVPKLKYTIKEYQELWYALRHFATRLETVSKAPFSMQDIEKVAFVIGHFEHSGYKQAATEVSGSEQANLGTKKEDSNAKEEKSNISSPPVVASTAKPDLGSETTADAQAKRRKRKR